MENSRAPSLDAAGRVLTFGSRHPIDGSDKGPDDDLYIYRVRQSFDAARETGGMSIR
jgi:hypothetical protein